MISFAQETPKIVFGLNSVVDKVSLISLFYLIVHNCIMGEVCVGGGSTNISFLTNATNKNISVEFLMSLCTSNHYRKHSLNWEATR